MQVACIKCNEPLDADFGMVKCKSCGELMLVDLMGEVQAAMGDGTRMKFEARKAEQAPPEESADPNNEEAPQEASEEIEAPPEEIEVPGGDGAPSYRAYREDEDVPISMAPEAEEIQIEKTVAPPKTPKASPPPPPPPSKPRTAISIDGKRILEPVPAQVAVEAVNEEIGNWSYNPARVEEYLATHPGGSGETDVGRKNSEDLGDLVEFAHSDVSSGREGPFLYAIVIEGIDSRELRTAVGEALTDRKFGWDPNEIMTALSSGRLVIKNVNPVKASVLVRRLKTVNVRVTWEQHALSQL